MAPQQPRPELPLPGRTLGATILPEHKVTLIRPVPGGSYQVESRNPLNGQRWPAPTTARVMVAVGVTGTLQLLTTADKPGRCRRSRSSWAAVRTNSEAVVGVVARDRHAD